MLHRVSASALVALAMLMTVDASGAQPQRTFVASYGNDANPCSITLPCRGFAAAVAQTISGGEVIVLDSAGYGSVTVTQSVSLISPPGVYAGISAFTGDDGVIVAAGASDRVTLRGLSISGQGGMHGIIVDSGGEVHVENCIVANMTGNGIFILVTRDTRIQIRHTLVRSNGGVGLWVTGGGTPVVQVVDSEFSLNGRGVGVPPTPGIVTSSGTFNAQRIVVNANGTWGVIVAGDTGSSVLATIADSLISANGSGGVGAATAPSGGTTRVAVVRSTISGNGGDGLTTHGASSGMEIGLSVSDSTMTENAGAGVAAQDPTANALVTRSTIARNGVDLAVSFGATMRTSGNNTLTGRGAADISGTLTPNPPQ
jgi:Right handed beta helix region